MRLYLPKLYLILITNLILWNEIDSKSTEYGEQYIHSNNPLSSIFHENIDNDLTLNENNDIDDLNDQNDYIIAENPQHDPEKLFQPIEYDLQWRNTHKHDKHSQPLEPLNIEHDERIISDNLLKKLTENLLKQSTMPQISPTSMSSSSSSLPSTTSSTSSGLLPPSPMFHASLSRPSIIPYSWLKRSVLMRGRPYRWKRDDLGWKRSGIHYHV
ncbi:unnamed protein product [Schistosoma turkestanicum]|nr:unnamed protein product [Schistosoma turkestanicum]